MFRSIRGSGLLTPMLGGPRAVTIVDVFPTGTMVYVDSGPPPGIVIARLDIRITLIDGNALVHLLFSPIDRLHDVPTSLHVYIIDHHSL